MNDIATLENSVNKLKRILNKYRFLHESARLEEKRGITEEYRKYNSSVYYANVVTKCLEAINEIVGCIDNVSRLNSDRD